MNSCFLQAAFSFLDDFGCKVGKGESRTCGLVEIDGSLEEPRGDFFFGERFDAFGGFPQATAAHEKGAKLLCHLGESFEHGIGGGALFEDLAADVFERLTQADKRLDLALRKEDAGHLTHTAPRFLNEVRAETKGHLKRTHQERQGFFGLAAFELEHGLKKDRKEAVLVVLVEVKEGIGFFVTLERFVKISLRFVESSEIMQGGGLSVAIANCTHHQEATLITIFCGSVIAKGLGFYALLIKLDRLFSRLFGPVS